jgi:hypothetical protein
MSSNKYHAGELTHVISVISKLRTCDCWGVQYVGCIDAPANAHLQDHHIRLCVNEDAQT